jgi:hypothetical protein
LTLKPDEPEEPPESEQKEENVEEGESLLEAEEPKEEKVEPPPLISTEDTGDLLVSCFMYICMSCFI